MNRSEIQNAINSNAPFKIQMADGREYTVPHRDYIFLSPKGTYVHIVHGEDEDGQELTSSLPLLTMTGVQYKMSV